MEFSQVAVKRRTIRFFQKKSVAEEHLRALIDAARRVSSAANNQVLRYVVCRDPLLVESLFFCVNFAGRIKPRRSPEPGVNAPPAFIAVTAVVPKSTGEVSSMVYADAGAAIQTMEFAACDRGLGSCWIGSFRAKDATAILHLPPDRRLLFLLAVGHPAEQPVEEEIDAAGDVAYYLDPRNVLHVPKYGVDAIAEFR